MKILQAFYGQLRSKTSTCATARFLIPLAFLFSGLGAGEGGSIIFRNYSVYYDGTKWQPTNSQPIFLADCLTPASGSNYVVELLATSGQLLATASLGDGPYAGLFGGTWDFVSSDLLPQCMTVLLTVRIWDRSTGTNFDSASHRGALSFNNFILGGCCDPPCSPEELTGFRSFALGNPQCFTNQITFYAPENNPNPVHGSVPYFTAPRSHAQAVVTLQRAGDLGRTDVLSWSLVNGCPDSSLQCSQTSGSITLSPGQTVSQFSVSVSPQAIEHTVVSLSVALSNSNANLTLPVPTANLLFYDDEYLTVQWSGTSNAPVGDTRFDVFGFSPSGMEIYRLQYSLNLVPAFWSDVTNAGTAFFSGNNLAFDWEFAIPTNLVKPGFYRGIKQR